MQPWMQECLSVIPNYHQDKFLNLSLLQHPYLHKRLQFLPPESYWRIKWVNTTKALKTVCVCVQRVRHKYQLVLVVKNPPANAGDIRDTGSIPGSGKSPGEGNGNPLQYSCLENPTERGAWWATVHQSWTWLKQLSMHAFLHLRLHA